MSGASNIAAKAGKKFDLEDDKATLRKVLEQVQDLENAGYQFEAAEASFELLVRRQIGRYRHFFELDHYRVVVLRTNGNVPVAEATVKLQVNGKTEHHVAEGDGPVNALDGALRKALAPHYPAMDGVHLSDYKVRVINSKDETAAQVRVVIECRRDDGGRAPRELRYDRRQRQHHRRQLAGAGRRLRVPPAARRRSRGRGAVAAEAAP